MVWTMCFIAFALGVISMFILVLVVYTTKSEETVNKVKFYVARDKDGFIYLYIGKPKRRCGWFAGSYRKRSVAIIDENDFKMVGLNQDDFKDLKWEDEPVEVFINMED